MTENLLVGQKTKIPVLPTIFLVAVIVSTLWLFWYNYYIWKTNASMAEEQARLEWAINDLKTKKDIQIYELLSTYNNQLSKLERNSDLVKYMEHMDDIEKNYWVSFSGFSISDWEIKTTVTARRIWIRTESSTYKKVSDFIEKYRTDENALFELKFINSFEWMDEIKFNVSLKIKDVVKKVETPAENTTSTWSTENLTDNKN